MIYLSQNNGGKDRAITITAKDIMDNNVIYVKDNATVAETLSLMVEKDVW